jgi:hypothetical protein
VEASLLNDVEDIERMWKRFVAMVNRLFFISSVERSLGK